MREDAKKHLAEAAKFFAKGMEKYPDRIDFFERAARIETFREKPEDALAIVDKGLAAFPMSTKFDRLGLPAALGLANIKVEVLISKKDFDGVKKEIAALRELNNERVNAVADFHQARMLAVNEKWADAAAQLQQCASAVARLLRTAGARRGDSRLLPYAAGAVRSWPWKPTKRPWRSIPTCRKPSRAMSKFSAMMNH